MRLLAIDTALAAASACVLVSGSMAPLAGETLLMERGHAEALLPLLERVMARVDDGFAALDLVAVTIGPGSFTGIRVGLAAARAIGLACEIPVVGVSVLSALAAPLIADAKNDVVAAVVDARHGNVYFQFFAPDGSTLVDPCVVSAAEAVELTAKKSFTVTGPGARIVAAAAAAVGVAAEVMGSTIAPEITYVGMLGFSADPATTPPRPLYLRAPDARVQEHGRIALA